MTPQEAQERVARGAVLLDEKRPGWEQKIRVNELNMGSFCDCVIGQIEGDFLRWPHLAPANQTGLMSTRYYGFDSDGSVDGFELLQAAWLDAIAERLAPPITWTHRESETSTCVSSTGS